MARYAPKAHATSRALQGRSFAMANASIPMSTMPIAAPKVFAIRSQKTTKTIRAWLAQAATSAPKANATLHALPVKSNAAINASIRSQIMSIAVLRAIAQATTQGSRAPAAMSVLAALAISHALACKSCVIVYASILRPTTSIAVLAEGVIAIRS